MANRWGNNGNMRDFIFLVSKITADGDCSHEIKRHMFLERKAMAFPIVTYKCERWTIKKAEHQRIEAFKP